MPGWLPTVAGIALLLLAVVLLVLELYVTSYGVLTLAAIAAGIGGLYLVLGRVPWPIVIPTAIALLAISGFLTVMVLRAKVTPPLGDPSELVGRVVTVTSAVGADGGKVLLDGVYWTAQSRVEIPAGAKAVIRGANGLVLLVEPVT